MKRLPISGAVTAFRHFLSGAPSPSWQHLMSRYEDQLPGSDFFAVETLFLRTLYVLISDESGSRRMHVVRAALLILMWPGVLSHRIGWHHPRLLPRRCVGENPGVREVFGPYGVLEDREPNIRFPIRDNDKKFTEAFDTVFRSEGVDVIPIPVRAPNANAFMERWIRSAREECLDKLLIINHMHLRRVMRDYVEFFNTARPHQGLEQQIPVPQASGQGHGPVRCRTVLGGIIHDYYRDAA